MTRSLDQEELRKTVWEALFKFGGDRNKAAEKLGISLSTLNRRIRDMDLYADLDKAGLMRNVGPPRKGAPSILEKTVLAHIEANQGFIDHGKLVVELYGADNEKTRHRMYVLLGEYKTRGTIGTDGKVWFVISPSE